MRVEVYPDSDYNGVRTYDLPPAMAADRYPVDVGDHESYDLVVVPVDEEARALTGWQVETEPYEDESPLFMLFCAVPRPLEFDVKMVDTFRTTESKQ